LWFKAGFLVEVEILGPDTFTLINQFTSPAFFRVCLALNPVFAPVSCGLIKLAHFG
jgi:hypothetical protein